MNPLKRDRIVFIDRDGVINVDPIGDYVKSWEEFRFEVGALEALKRLSDSGLKIIIISNQAGVGDGHYGEKALREINRNMTAEFEKGGIRIHASHYCLHGKQAGCSCRKPETGLFKEAVKSLDYDPRVTYFVGDKQTDVQAGKRFGIRTIFVRTGHGRYDERKLRGDSKPDHVVNNLSAAVEIILR